LTKEALSPNFTLSSPSRQRRELLRQFSSGCLVLALLHPKAVLAKPQEKSTTNDFQFQIQTSLPNGFSSEDGLTKESQLIITVKPAVTYTDQVPEEIAESSLKATAHWVPVVLEYAMPYSSSTITLTKDHMTAAAADGEWWKNLPLIITAKLQLDGSKAGPNDLVGCRILLLQDLFGTKGDSTVSLPLQKKGICSDLLGKK